MTTMTSMTTTTSPGPRVFVGPDPLSDVLEAVRSSGCEVAESLSEADAVVWFGRDPAALADVLPAGVRWLQIPDAGAERWLASGLVGGTLEVTSARGAYAPQVAEHALALILACARRLDVYGRAVTWAPQAAAVSSLAGGEVLVVGAGGIGTALIAMLAPLGCRTVAVTRSGRDVPGASQSVAASDLDRCLPSADVVVLAAPATAETAQLVNATRIGLMKPSAILVNVARGTLVDTDALLAALDRGHLSAVGLDVTDPEPLPAGHPLLTHPRVIVTPHVANPPALKRAAFARHVADNCARFKAGISLSGIIEEERGY